MNIVLLDGHTINPGDLSWKPLEDLCDRFPVYERTAPEEIGERIANCEILMTSKCLITRELLARRSLGIVGYGAIGRRVGEIAEALGMSINVYSRDRQAAVTSDFVTLHCPLTTENAGMINREFIDAMKPGAFLINTARGGLVNEADLAAALNDGTLAGAAVDVLSAEPAY